MIAKPELSGDEKALLYQVANTRRREMLWHDFSIIAPTMGMVIFGLFTGNPVLGMIGIGLYLALRLRGTVQQERASEILSGGIQKLLDRYEGDDGSPTWSEQGGAREPATAPGSKSEGNEKPEPESETEGRSL